MALDPTLYADAASAFNPALAGYAGVANAAPSFASGVDASISPTWASASPTSSFNAADLGKALTDLSKGMGGDQSGGKGVQGQPIAAQAGQARSGTGQGSPAGINALIQLLMSKANAYFPGQPNPKPVALGRPSGGGLLGI